MAKAKKVILFIVEGVTDKYSLGLVLSQLLEREDIQFAITDGDVTTKKAMTSQNIVKEVSGYVRRLFQKQHYLLPDLLETIHLIDTDGAFIPETAVVDGPTMLSYTPTAIQTTQKQNIWERNRKKKQLVELLRTKSDLLGKPYRLYYFSRNLEHILHDKPESLSREEKNDLADQFSDQYGNHPDEFVCFMNQTEFTASGDYDTSWNFIQQDLHSLERWCNFHLYLNHKKASNEKHDSPHYW